MNGYIYKLTCIITDKVYIGKTIDINRREAAKSINKNTSHIVSCCKENRKTAYGFIWGYEGKEVTHG